MKRVVIAVALILGTLSACLGSLAGLSSSQEETNGIFLPGTQPLENDVEFGKVAQCKMCHNKTKNGDADPVFSWQGGMMAQAARDPVFYATLAVANQDVPGVGEFCIRCHAPRGWLQGRSKQTDGSGLTREDRNGVACMVCHRLVDPVSQEAATLVKTQPPGYGNAMMVVDPNNQMRGPYAEQGGVKPHTIMQSEYQGSGQLCATCHNVSNPLLGDVINQSPHTFGHVERTFSEWLLSEYSEKGREGSCQSCHFPSVKEGGQASRYTSPHRDYFVKHGPVGGSTWVQKAVAYVWAKDPDVDPNALTKGIERARANLQRAATVELRQDGPGKAILRITNETGHKLPTGYPEGRRMWVQARFCGSGGEVLKEIGQYGEKDDTLSGEKVSVPTLLDPEATRVYENQPGMSPGQAEKFDKKPGKSFHFVLNDVILKDNRIPPRGFKHEAFKEHLAAPVGAQYTDAQYWDEMELVLPVGTTKVEARVLYQSVSWEYLKFLIEQNRTNDWGKRLYKAWQETGQCTPEVVGNEVVLAVE